MDAFETKWETSRHNSWSWGYPTAICLGVVSLFAFSFVHRCTLRRTLKSITIFVSASLAADFSAREIQEKWRIRGEWAETHKDRMTDAGWDALMTDGANLVLGPLIYEFQAMAILMGVAFMLFVVRKAAVASALQNTISDTSDSGIASALPVSSIPHSPPNDIKSDLRKKSLIENPPNTLGIWIYHSQYKTIHTKFSINAFAHGQSPTRTE
jgi:hypothetical protein